jgi:hypothetical protein
MEPHFIAIFRKSAKGAHPMKKLIGLGLVLVFVATFALGALTSNVAALPPDTIECIDGKLWICTWDYIGNGAKIKLVQNCHWAGPC